MAQPQHEWFDSPVDLPAQEGRDRYGLGWATGAIALATLLLAALNAVAIQDWADELRPSPLQAEVAAAADRWVEITDAAGLGTPRAALHAAWKRAQAARFGAEEAPVEPLP